MNFSYLFIVIAIVALFVFFKLLKKTSSMLKSTFLFLLLFTILGTGFVWDNQNPGQVTNAVSSLKNLITRTNDQTSSFSDNGTQMPIIKIKDRVLLDAPAVSQFPELPRGCEVTSLAMLLSSTGLKVDKLKLAAQIKKEDTFFNTVGGKVFFGNPNAGFVGNMYDFSKPGLGVYHTPIKELAEKYLPGKIDDLTGSDFEDLKIHLSDNRPVWVIINTTYQKLEDNQFQTWMTPSGPIKITYKEHSVLLTGYDKNNVYFNDPLTGEKNKKAPIKDFKESWVQMGRQAITYLPS
ncbi:MAG: C39 family peptidase [Bacillota bacterium]|nr:C39 family peptidase [Bacillota bacterium]MDP4169585.1 C39 family peptidase [Bacillota bacterium]